MRPLAAAALALFFAVPAGAKRPEPQPAPKIVFFGPTSGQNYGAYTIAIDSNGNRYELEIGGDIVATTFRSATLIHNVFNGPPPSPIVNTTGTGLVLYLMLANGDIWQDYYDPARPDQAFSKNLGNVFTIAAGGARLPDFPTFDVPEAPSMPQEDLPLHPGAEQ